MLGLIHYKWVISLISHLTIHWARHWKLCQNKFVIDILICCSRLVPIKLNILILPTLIYQHVLPHSMFSDIDTPVKIKHHLLTTCNNQFKCFFFINHAQVSREFSNLSSWIISPSWQIYGKRTLYTFNRVCPAMPWTTPRGKPTHSSTGPCSMWTCNVEWVHIHEMYIKL